MGVSSRAASAAPRIAATAALLLAACGAGEKPAPRVGPPGRIAVSFEDTLGEAFGLELVEVSLDGKVVLACGGTGAQLDARSPVFLWEGSAGPGEHELQLRLVYRGKGYGIFSYLSGYTFEVKSRHAVDIPPAGFRAVHATAYERGDPTTPIEERPQVRFEEQGDDAIDAGKISCPAVRQSD
jgi:hypothetical protein